MKDKNKFLVAGMSIGLFGLVFAASASALTYQEEIPVSFTFNRGLSISVSASDLHIYNLTPGTSDDSNIITVTTTTNNVTGYVLTASVGNSTKNTTNLVNGGSNFASIATNASQASLTTDNTWGYSISTNNGSTWSNYSGLPIFSSTNWKELASVNANGTTSILFKIGAKASAAQPAGDYTNVINFTATTNPRPIDIEVAFEDAGKTRLNGYYKMQDMTSAICNAVEVTNSQAQLIDTRDNKVYYVAKLADGNCWMTQNLDFDIVNGGSAISSANTDVPSNWAGAGSLTNTYASNVITWDTAASGRTTPQSYDPGNLCWNGTIRSDYNGTLANSTTACSQSGSHYHIGNYYNWTAAVAMVNSSSYTADGTNVNQSICPAGWTLPKGGNNTSSGSFAYLVNQASLTSGTSGNVHTSPYYFAYDGIWVGDSSGYVGDNGFYWSSTVSDGYFAYRLFLDSNGDLYPNDLDYRTRGNSVRCVAK